MDKQTRIDIKRSAKKTLRKHYFLLLVLCMVAALLGSDFAGSRQFLHQLNTNASAGQQQTAIENSVLPKGASEVFYDIATDNAAKGDKQAEDILASYQAEKGHDQDVFVGRTRGVLAVAADNFSSGHFLVTAFQSIRSVAHSEHAATVIFVVSAMAIQFFIWFFVINMLSVMMRRIFLEARVYDKIYAHRLMHARLARRWTRAAKTIFMQKILQFLWTLTIVGGPIKFFSYYMVPYIVAENPDIRPMDAISLSRRMMNGHKWECFKLELTFLGWQILGMLTLGITDMFFTNPYKTLVMSSYYEEIRRQAKTARIEGSEQLNDVYLFKKAPAELLSKTYDDVSKRVEDLEVSEVKLTKVQQFFADNFAIWIGTSENRKRYMVWQEEEYRVDTIRHELDGTAYPIRLCPLKIETRARAKMKRTPFRAYTIWTLLLMFFLFSFGGWVWEGSLHIITSGHFVNRGTMVGPWLPIYGCGIVGVMLLLSRFRKRPALMFGMTMVLCGILEYTTSYVLQEMYHQRWWDYTGYLFNLNGRICAEGLLVFGIGGIACVYFIAPLLDQMISKIPVRILIPITVILVLLFSADAVYSRNHPHTGSGITSYSAYKTTESSSDKADDKNAKHSGDNGVGMGSLDEIPIIWALKIIWESIP